MNWREENDSLVIDLTFGDFAEAWAFMTEVAIHAEKQNHHPEWSNVYSKVSIKLTTHDEGNTVTAKDRRLAETISTIYSKYVQG